MSPLKFLAKFALILALATSVLGSAGTSPASAYTDEFCPPSSGYIGLYGNNACVSTWRHSYTSIAAIGEYDGPANSVCAGAQNYGSYICHHDWSCHTYGGSNLLYGTILHHAADTAGARSMKGRGTYSQGAFNGCARGDYLSLNKDTAARRQVLNDKLPVFAKAQAGPAPSAQVLRAHGIDLDADGSRSFATPAGKGWITTDSRHDKVCLLLADGTDGYGLACERRGKAVADGIEAVLLKDPASNAATATTIIAKPGADEVAVSAATPTAALDAISKG